MAVKILLVEDDAFLQDGLSELLSKQGYIVDAAGCCEKANALFSSTSYHMIILDVMLPDGDGVSLCRAWRGKGSTMPILFLTARDEEIDIVRGLDAGADDYIAKPFGALELLSRVRALLRRFTSVKQEYDGLVIDLKKMTVYKEGRQVFITPTEFQLLHILLTNAGRIITRQMLLQEIWDSGGNFIEDNTLSVHMSRLRDKIGDDHISTIRGVGYRWEDKV